LLLLFLIFSASGLKKTLDLSEASSVSLLLEVVVLVLLLPLSLLVLLFVLTRILGFLDFFPADPSTILLGILFLRVGGFIL
jgi:hypothetical protein